MNQDLRIVLTWALVACLTAAPVAAQGSDPADGTSALGGKVVSADGKAPVEGATVLAYHLSSEALFSSAPTNAKGDYTINGLPYGYFDLAVDTPDGLFVGNQVLNVAPSARAAANFTLTPTPEGQAGPRDYPGSDETPTGLASVTEKLTGRAFWRSPRGVAILAGAGAVALLALAGGGGSSSNETPVSPF